MPKLKIHPSFVLIFLCLLAGDNKKLTLSVLICMAIHEIGHIMLFYAFKIKIKEISLGATGATITPALSLTSYKKEIAVAIGGPFLNLVTLALVYPSINIYEPALFGMREYVAIFSLMFAIINLMPVYDLDGGRILKCALSMLFTDSAGERVVNVCTTVFLIGIWMLSVYMLLKSRGGFAFFAFSICMMLRKGKRG